MKKVELEKVEKCLLCKRKNFSLLYKVGLPEKIHDVSQDQFNLVKCDNCGLVFVNPRPIAKHIGLYYPDDCQNFYQKKRNRLDDLGMFLKKKEVHKNVKGKKVLDVGFGSGDYLEGMSELGWECYGVDISKLAFDNLSGSRSDFNLKNTNLKGAKYPKGFFDLIRMSAVLEHVPNPLSDLKKIHKILKPGGEAYFMVPNNDGLYYKVAKENADYLAPQHLVFFTPETISEMLEEAGFKKIKIDTEIGNLTSYYILKRIGVVKSFYQKSVFKQLLGLIIMPTEIFLNMGDVLIARVEK